MVAGNQFSKMVIRRVDLRSDTVTKPTETMRAAMAAAEVDDDVLGNDPTALGLETEMAKMMGKEAALFVPSGTMGNLTSVLVHCDVRGSEVCFSKSLGAPVGSVIVGSQSFIKNFLEKISQQTLGGGMRIIGNNCVAAFIAVQENVGKLEGDHKKAKTLADGLNKIKGLRENVASVETNIYSSKTKVVTMDIVEGSKMTTEKLCKKLEEHGIFVLALSLVRIQGLVVQNII
ncbi:hypothetical protein UlMin_030037 [Ulmus minor]